MFYNIFAHFSGWGRARRGGDRRSVTNKKASASLVTAHISTNLYIILFFFLICSPTDSVSHFILYQLELCKIGLNLNLVRRELADGSEGWG